MFPTVEVRWFYQGEIPADIQTWFDQIAEECIVQPARLDTYLLQQNHTDLGIKLRQGRFEIKQRFQQHGVVSFHKHVSGAVESWRKWSFLIAREQNGYFPPAILGDTWLGVKKARSMYIFQITDNGVKSVPMPDYSAGGCNLELTQIEASGTLWWSLGLEAFGDERTNYNRFKMASKYIFSRSQQPGFDTQSSFGYPQWLENVRKNSDSGPRRSAGTCG